MNQVTIYNIALLHLAGKGKLTSTAENGSKELAACNTVWDFSVDEVLRDHHWGFATRKQSLALLTYTPIGYQYAYAYPNDCVKARFIDYGTGEDPPPFELQFDDTDNTVIATDRADAILVYTKRILSAEKLPTHFVSALAWRIAHNVALSLTGDVDIQKWALQMYAGQLSVSAASDANEGFTDNRDVKPTWLAARA